MKLILYVLPLAITSQVAAQSTLPTAVEAMGATPTTFEMLKTKNRSRFYFERPDPRGTHHVFLDDYNLNSGNGLSPEIQAQPGTRRVTSIVSSLTPSRLDLTSSEVSIGTVRLRGSAATTREIYVDSILNLKQPLRVRVRERARPSSD